MSPYKLEYPHMKVVAFLNCAVNKLQNHLDALRVRQPQGWWQHFVALKSKQIFKRFQKKRGDKEQLHVFRWVLGRFGIGTFCGFNPLSGESRKPCARHTHTVP